MFKETKRKGFNFFRSYYDVYNELETIEDKVAFIDALLDRQFLGVKPTGLTGMAKFAWISQVNSIDSQVKGYEDKTRTKIGGTPPPTARGSDTPTEGGSDTPTLQVQEKVQEKEKEKEVFITISHNNFLKTLKQKSQWLETVAMQQKTKNEIVVIYLDKFENHLITMQEQKKNIKDFKSHFVYWLNKQDLSQFREKTIGKSNQIR